MTHKEYADSLRQIADFFEQHTEVKLPYDAENFNYFDAVTKNQIAQLARALGEVKKEFDVGWEGSFAIVHQFGHIQFRAMANKASVCVRVVTGTRLVEEKVIPSVPECIIPAHQEEIVEWKCSEPILSEPKE